MECGFKPVSYSLCHRANFCVQSTCLSNRSHADPDRGYESVCPWHEKLPKFFIFSADLATLKQTLQMASEQMRQTGVGGLPLLPVPDDGHPPPALPTEDEMIAQATRAVQVSYDQLKRGQDSAAVVANLLTSVERPPVHR